MITKENLEKLLIVLKFTKDLSGTFWRRDFPVGCALEVDVKGEKFYYEKAGITVTGATTVTANFSATPREYTVTFDMDGGTLSESFEWLGRTAFRGSDPEGNVFLAIRR